MKNRSRRYLARSHEDPEEVAAKHALRAAARAHEDAKGTMVRALQGHSVEVDAEVKMCDNVTNS